MDMFGMLINGVFSYGVGKSIDTIVECFKCNERGKMKINNVSKNTIQCKNCHVVLDQFTHACGSTISDDGRIGHVNSNLKNCHVEDIYKKGWLTDKWLGDRVVVPVSLKAKDYSNKQFVSRVQLLDYKEKKPILDSGERILKLKVDGLTWDHKLKMELNEGAIPTEYRDDRVFAVVHTLYSDQGEVLSVQRNLQHLWKDGKFIPTIIRVDA